MLACAFVLFSCGLHEIIPLDAMTEEKMVSALQEALVLGSQTAAKNLGNSTCEMKECVTGYLGNKLVEIALPDTVKNVLYQMDHFSQKLEAAGFINALNAINRLGFNTSGLMSEYLGIFEKGFDKYADDIKTALNRGAEQAAPDAIGVFRDAIFGMSFGDAKGVLMGNSIAATSYLKTSTYAPLKVAFAPIIEEPLKLLNPNQYWQPLASRYNKFAKSYSNFQKQINSSSYLSSYSSALEDLPYGDLPEDLSNALATYATGKALDGLFLMVGRQESELRADPWGTVSSLGSFISDGVGNLLSDVFGKAKDGLL